MPVTIENEDPLFSSNPEVVKAERENMQRFAQEEARKDKERMQQKTIEALAGIRAPVMVGGASAGGLSTT